ncbi:MAG: ATP-binding cassette domain-containing protein, partial [Candidatus Rokubacteria bacterium]|nr:ATP-binding cassette domain-containing protein [Candidatus Rokubacteria bacterium]
MPSCSCCTWRSSCGARSASSAAIEARGPRRRPAGGARLPARLHAAVPASRDDHDLPLRLAGGGLEHPRRLLRPDLARPRRLLRHRRLHVDAAGAGGGADPVGRPAGGRAPGGGRLAGHRLSGVPPARPLLRDRHHRGRRDRPDAVDQLGLGGRRARGLRPDQAPRQPDQLPVPPGAGLVLLHRARPPAGGAGGDARPGALPRRLLLPRDPRGPGGGGEPRRAGGAREAPRHRDLGGAHGGGRHLLRAVRPVRRPGVGVRALALDPHLPHRRAGRRRHPLGARARRRRARPALRGHARDAGRRWQGARPDDLRRAHRADRGAPARRAHGAHPPAGAAVSLLAVAGLTKRFGGVVANRDVSFEVGPGELVGVIGPNGAGKSTLFRLITKKESPDSGKISVGKTVK